MTERHDGPNDRSHTMTEQPPRTEPARWAVLDRDYGVMAWAAARTQHVRDKYRGIRDRADYNPTRPLPPGARAHLRSEGALMALDDLFGGGGSVLGPFDPRAVALRPSAPGEDQEPFPPLGTDWDRGDYARVFHQSADGAEHDGPTAMCEVCVPDEEIDHAFALVAQAQQQHDRAGLTREPEISADAGATWRDPDGHDPAYDHDTESLAP